MFAHTITFVAGEAILRILRVEFDHEAVAGDFGDDAGGGDGNAKGVAADERRVVDGEAAHGESVDEGVVGFRGQGLDGAGHGEVGGAKDVEGIDFLDAGGADGPVDFGAGGQGSVEAFAFFGGELFGVIEADEGEVRRQDDGGGDDGAGEGSASGFVDTGHQRKPASAQGTLAGKIAGHRTARKVVTRPPRWRGLFPSPWWRICLCGCGGS